jgi:hypothetical protein
MIYLKTKSPTIANNKKEFTSINGSLPGNWSSIIKSPPIPINKKETIKYSAKSPISIFRNILFCQ